MLDLTDWQSKKFQTRGGNPDVRLLCVDGPGEYPIVGFVDKDLIRWSIAGIYSIRGEETHYDLINAKTKREGWVNIYKDRTCIVVKTIYDTKQKAESVAANIAMKGDVVACIRIEWEE